MAGIPPLKDRSKQFTGLRQADALARQIDEVRSFLQEAAGPQEIVGQSASVVPGKAVVDVRGMAASCTVRLYKATPGNQVLIVNGDGSCSGAKTITILASGDALINGAANLVLVAAYGSANLIAVRGLGKTNWVTF